MDKALSKPRIGDLRIQKKIILNKENPNYTEVVIGEIEVYKNRFGESIHYLISFGGGKTIRIIGKKNWDAFVSMIQWLEWNPQDTQELYIPTEIRDDTLPYYPFADLKDLVEDGE